MYQDTIKNEIEVSDGKLIIPVTNTQKAMQYVLSMKDKQYDITIDEHSNKRSTKANSYCWELCSMIADKLTKSKDEVYIQSLRDYGVSDRLFIIKEAFDSLKRSFKYSEIQEEFTRGDKVWVDCLVIHGSSTYNSKEMYHLIMGLRADGIEQGLEVRTPSEILEMSNAWEMIK